MLKPDLAFEADLALGIDLGTSGLRLAVIDAQGVRLTEESSHYPSAFEDPQGWQQGLIQLCEQLPIDLRQRIAGLAVDGTSGTLLMCRADGSLPNGSLGLALPYHQSCPDQAETASELAGGGPAASASGSLARALKLMQRARVEEHDGPWLLRHQADWMTGWLLGDWRWGEEGNNLRLGWCLNNQHWVGDIAKQSWSGALPEIQPSGLVLGTLAPAAASRLGIPERCQVVAGSTDANAAVLAAEPGESDGVTVLGTTLVLKQWSPDPIQGPGVSCHRVGGRWLLGGASNAGGGVLKRYFNDEQLKEISRQIDPIHSSGLHLRPLLATGERFPVDDPSLQPILEPRPVSDALFLQALLEGLGAIEREGWQRLEDLGAPAVKKIISVGGGACNPQWRIIRQRLLQRPIINRPGLSAALGMARLAARAVLNQT